MRKYLRKNIATIVLAVLVGVLVPVIVVVANSFPGTLNNYSAGQGITSAWANALEAKIGADDSTTSSSLDHLTKHASSSLGSIANIAKTKGNLIIGNGSAWYGLMVGSDGKVATASSTAPYGVSWETVAGTPGGSDTQIQFNNGGAFAGDSNFTWSSSTKTFTITDGGFNVGTSTATGVITGVTPTEAAHLTTKAYADLLRQSAAEYYIASSSSDVAPYLNLFPRDSKTPETSITSSSISAGDDQFLFGFITTSTIPNSLEAGTYEAHFHLSKSGGGQVMKVYWTMSSFSSSSVETVRMTSELSNELGTDVFESLGNKLR